MANHQASEELGEILETVYSHFEPLPIFFGKTFHSGYSPYFSNYLCEDSESSNFQDGNES